MQISRKKKIRDEEYDWIFIAVFIGKSKIASHLLDRAAIIVGSCQRLF